MKKIKFLEEGIPYQILIASVIHKFGNGKLKNITTYFELTLDRAILRHNT